MAKDLGNLNIEIDVNKKSINDAFEDGGKSAGKGFSATIQNILEKLLSPSGGGSGSGLNLPGGRGGGLNLGTGGNIKSIITKVAAIIGVVALLGAAFGVVIKTIMSWGRELEATTIKLGKVNAALAMQAAEMQVGELMRDIKSADVLEPFLLESKRKMEDIKNQLRPIMDLIAVIKSIIFSEVMNRLGELVKNLAPIAQGVAYILIVVNILRDIKSLVPGMKALGGAANLAGGGMFGLGFELLKWAAGGDSPKDKVQNLMDNFTEYRIEQTEALLKIVAQLKNTNDTHEAVGINHYMGQVGIALTEDKWNPWKTVPPGGSP